MQNHKSYNRLAVLEDGRTGQLKLKLIQDDTIAYDIKIFTRDQLRTSKQIFSWIADVLAELRKHGIQPEEADKLFEGIRIPGLSVNEEGEVFLAAGPISSQGQIKIKSKVKPYLPWESGDNMEFFLKDKDVVIRNSHKKA